MNGIILFNVVVAVLLDKCMNQDDDSAAESDTEVEPDPPEKRLKEEGEAIESPLIGGVRRDKSMAMMPLRRDHTMGVMPLASPPQRGKVLGARDGTSIFRVVGSGESTRALPPGEVLFANQPATPSNDADEAMLSGLCSSMSMLNKQVAIIVAAMNDNQKQLDSLGQEVAPSTPTFKVGL